MKLTGGGGVKRRERRTEGEEGGRKEKKGILTYFWSLQTVLFGVVQKGGHVIIQLGLQTVDQVSESR